MEITTGPNVDKLVSKPTYGDKKSIPRSHLRLQYESEVEVIKSKLGNLEEIRRNIGLSRRKMCQLLMVDPSAWTRWCKAQSVPPHIYRSLQWYMALIEKDPIWHPQNSFNRLSGKISLDSEVAILKKQVKQLQSRDIPPNKPLSITLSVLTFVAAFFLGAWFF